ncbi:hypothetical protein Tco_0222414 [Tanacetum coccineum]
MLWEPLPKDVVGASTQRCCGSLYPKMWWEPLPKDVVGASTQRCGGSLYPKMLWMPHGKWRSGAQGCKAWRPSFIAWSGGQGWWSGGQDVGVVPKGVAWGKRVIMGRVHGCFWTANISPVSTNSAAPTTLNNEDTPLSSSIIVEDNEAHPLVSSSTEQISPISIDVGDEYIQEVSADLDRNTLITPFNPPVFEEAKSSSTTQDPNIIGVKWLWKNKTNVEIIVIRNKSHLVAKGYCQEEGINFEESFAPFYQELKNPVYHHRVAKDLWERVQLLMQGTSLTKQERECKLYDAFDKFTYIKGETLHKYYLIFTQLINGMNIYDMKIEQFQVNIKFLISLPREWSKFVTDVKLVKDLNTTNFDQLHAYLEQHELHANEVRLLRERNQDPLAFVANQQMTPPHFNTYQSSYNNPQL